MISKENSILLEKLGNLKVLDKSLSPLLLDPKNSGLSLETSIDMLTDIDRMESMYRDIFSLPGKTEVDMIKYETYLIAQNRLLFTISDLNFFIFHIGYHETGVDFLIEVPNELNKTLNSTFYLYRKLMIYLAIPYYFDNIRPIYEDMDFDRSKPKFVKDSDILLSPDILDAVENEKFSNPGTPIKYLFSIEVDGVSI